nr:hypothetical protein BDDEJBFL_00155 [Agrobacterium fabrum]
MVGADCVRAKLHGHFLIKQPAGSALTQGWNCAASARWEGNLDVTLRVAGQTLIDVRVRDGGPKGEDFILKASAQPTARSQRVTPHSGKPSPAYVQGLGTTHPGFN